MMILTIVFPTLCQQLEEEPFLKKWFSEFGVEEFDWPAQTHPTL